MKKTIGLIVLIFLAGCAGKPPVVDNSSKNPTAVFNAKGAISGYVLPDSTFTEVVYTRNDRRTMSTKREYDSWVARQFFGNSSDTVILRMDRNLRWALFDDDGDKKYTECPLVGCATASLKQFDPGQSKDKGDQAQFDYDPNDEEASACPTHITQNSFKVTDTGKTREIAGHLTKEYRADWVVEYQDDKGRKDSNRLTIVFWNAEPNADMKEVWAINAEADKTYWQKIKQDKNSLAILIPDDIFVALSAFTGSDSKDSKKWANKISRELAKAKGYPMSTKVEWYLDRKACVEPQIAKKKDSFDWMNPIDSMTKSASDMASEKAAEMFLPDPNEPIFRYEYEVTGAAIKYEHDSVFDVPPGYKLTTRQ
jgi:hypothetical protein